MIGRRLLGRLLVGALLALLWNTPAEPGNITSADKVKAKATASKIGIDGKQTVTITLNIDKGWYIYANPVAGPKNYDDNRTQVTIKGLEKVSTDFNYPVGKIKTDEQTKEQFRIYENQVVIQGQVRRTAGTGPLQIRVEINACNNDTCLRTGTIALTVP